MTPARTNVAETWLDLLESILRGQLDSHQRLLACIERKREAIRTANIEAVSRICADEHAILLKATDLEKHRLELVGRITQAMAAEAAKPMSVGEIAAQLPEPRQSRLIVLGAQLREALSEVKKQSSIVRAAADALGRHMTGIMQTVHSALSRARVYGHKGQIALGAQVSSTVDVKS